MPQERKRPDENKYPPAQLGTVDEKEKEKLTEQWTIEWSAKLNKFERCRAVIVDAIEDDKQWESKIQAREQFWKMLKETRAERAHYYSLRLLPDGNCQKKCGLGCWSCMMTGSDVERWRTLRQTRWLIDGEEASRITHFAIATDIGGEMEWNVGNGKPDLHSVASRIENVLRKPRVSYW
jgi:hypothetical protein